MRRARLDALNSRVLLLAALLTTSAWGAEPAADALTIMPRSLDLSSDLIREIVRESAATQLALVQVAEEKPVEIEADKTVKYVPPIKKKPVKRAAPRPARERESNGLISALAEMLVVEALGVEDELPDAMVDCPWPDDLMSANHYEACWRAPK